MTTAYIAARWTDFGQVGHHHARLSDAIERPSVGMRHGPAPRISPNICACSRLPECDLKDVLSRHHPPCASGVLPSNAVAVRQL